MAAKKKYRFLDIEDIKNGVPFPEPKELTAEEEAEILAQAKEKIDPMLGEAEFAELLRQHELGLLVSGDELLAMLDELEPADDKPQEESA
jgi:hypothetical protein